MFNKSDIKVWPKPVKLKFEWTRLITLITGVRVSEKVTYSGPILKSSSSTLSLENNIFRSMNHRFAVQINELETHVTLNLIIIMISNIT